MDALPAVFGRAVYAEVDEAAGTDPLQQAAGWLARLEPWFGACRSVGIARNTVGAMAVTVVSAGHGGDRAVIVHLARGRPARVGPQVRIEGSSATLQIADEGVRLTGKGALLDATGIDLPSVDDARAAILNAALARALASREVETIDG